MNKVKKPGIILLMLALITAVQYMSPAGLLPFSAAALDSDTINAGLTLTENTVHSGDLYLTGGTLDLNGYRLYISGDLMHEGGTLSVNSGQLQVQGDYRIQNGGSYSSGTLRMINEADYVRVQGNFIMDSRYSHSNLITNGVLEVKEDFTQKSSYTGSSSSNASANFRASGTHKVLLSGNSLQTVSFEDVSASGSYYSCFNILEISNTSSEGIDFATRTVIVKELMPTTTPFINPVNVSFAGTAPAEIGYWPYDLGIYANWTLQQDLTVAGDLIIKSGTLNLNGYRLNLGGRLYMQGGVFKLDEQDFIYNEDLVIQSGTIDLNGASVIIEGALTGGTINLNGGNLTVTGDLNPGDVNINQGSLAVKGDLLQEKGTLTVGGGRLVVEGDYRIQGQKTDATGNTSYTYSDGRLVMTSEADCVRVQGSFIMDSRYSHSNLLTNGVLEVKEDFTQKSSYNSSSSSNTSNNFRASGTHKVLLSGNSLQTVSFEDVSASGSYYSCFNILEISNTSSAGIDFATRTVIVKELMPTTTPFINPVNIVFTGSATAEIGYWSYDLGIYANWTLQQDLTVAGDLIIKSGTLNLNGYRLNLGGRLYMQGGVFKLDEQDFIYNEDLVIQSGTIDLNGASVIIEGALTGGTINLNGGNLTVKKDLIQPNGTLTVGGGRLVVEGDYRIQGQKTDATGNISYTYSSGTLRMTSEDDYVLVQGNFIMDSRYSHSGSLTNGVLEVKGDFTQKSSYRSSKNYYERNNFRATGTHKVLLSGNILQTVSFEDTSFNTSYHSCFNILEITKPLDTGYSFNKIPVWNKLISRAETLGEFLCALLGSDPVNLSTGNFFMDATDISIPTPGLPLEFTRFYNSLDTNNGPLGKGWTHSYHSRLTFNADGSVNVYYADGHVIIFNWDGSGYLRPPGCFETLARGEGNTYVLTFKDQRKYIYDSAGKLIRQSDRNGNVTTIAYTGDLLSAVTDPAGRSLLFTYDDNRRLTGITDPAGRQVYFSCDADGNLASVQDVRGGITHYSYDGNGLTHITDPRDHTVVHNLYDDSGRVTSQADGRGNITQFAYDPLGQKTVMTDPKGNAVTVAYDEKYRTTATAYPDDKTEAYTYDNNNCRTGETDRNGHTTTCTYDGTGNLLTRTAPAPLGYTMTYVYDSLNNPVQFTDAAGYVTDYAYDEKGNLLSVSKEVYGVTAVTSFAYNEYGQVTGVTDPNGNTTLLEYDTCGNQSSVTDPLGNISAYTYDNAGRMLTRTNPLGHTTAYTYDQAGNVLTITDPLGNVTTNTYDQNGNRTAITDPKGNVTAFTYDPNNKLTAATDPHGGVTTFGYDAENNLVSVTDPRGHTTAYGYDFLNRLISTTYPDGSAQTCTLDGNGNTIACTDPRGNTTTYEYDVANRLIKTTDPAGGSVTIQYDPVGNTTGVTDPRGHITTYAYDQASRLLAVTDPLGHAAGYTYDPAGNMTRYTDPRGAGWTHTYDAANRLLKTTDPLGHITRRTYDPAGNPVSLTRPDGSAINYSYDINNRLAGVAYPDGSRVAYAYDANGNRTTMTDPRGTTGYSYDNLDRLTSVTRAVYSIGYDYDLAGNITGLTYPGGRNITYTYDGLNRLQSVTDAVYTATFAYDELGNITAEQLPNGVTANYQYDDNGRLVSIWHIKGNTVLTGTDYTLDNLGNRTSATDERGETTRYTYDNLNQLTRVEYPDDQPVEYTYDPVGNRLRANNTTYAYDAANRLLRVDTTPYGYDLNGNLTSVGEAVYYSYDYENRLVSYTDYSKTLHYTYDGDGNRTGLSVAGAVYGSYEYIYDINAGLPRLLVEKHNAKEENNYIYAGRILSGMGSAGQLYYHHDGLGSISVVSDVYGNPLNRYTYDAFGSPRSVSESVYNPFMFTGEPYDPSGLIYLRARYYDPSIGRFLTPDTLMGQLNDPLSQNRYVYCGNNPVVYVDPSGHVKICNIYDSYFTGNQFSINNAILLASIDTHFSTSINPYRSVQRKMENSWNYTKGKASEAGTAVYNEVAPVVNDWLNCPFTPAGAGLNLGTGMVKGFKAGKGLFKSTGSKAGDFKFPKSSNDINKIFGINEKIFHKEIKPEIIKQVNKDPIYSKEFKKMGNNPDIGVDSTGNIILKDVETGKTLQTNWSFENFMP